jgi:hypothetical protein
MAGLRYLESGWTAKSRAEIAIKFAHMRAEMGPRYRQLLIRFGGVTERLKANRILDQPRYRRLLGLD